MSSASKAIFISHANPEDNAFTLWLAAKLSSLGYEVWADVMRLRGRSCRFPGERCEAA
ncbi:MAG: TIR domain-containing protein [Vulcanimicrobiaceae bacterium]